MASSDATFVEDAGRGLRKIVTTPKPLAIKEIDVIDVFMSNNHIVVVAGGGSVPVVESGEALVGIEAVIDKDFVSQKLAQVLDADMFIVHTAVDNVYVNFNQPDQSKPEQVTYSELVDYI